MYNKNMSMDINIGYKIRKIRQNNNQTLEQTAKVLGISSSALGMYERGMRNPDIKVLLKLANHFNVDLEYFYNGSKEEIESIKNILGKENSYSEREIKLAKARAKGNCELCGKRAPFFQNNGEPYLEVYLLDRIHENEKVVLLCPNCKRKLEILNLPSDLNYLRSIFIGEEYE